MVATPSPPSSPAFQVPESQGSGTSEAALFPEAAPEEDVEEAVALAFEAVGAAGQRRTRPPGYTAAAASAAAAEGAATSMAGQGAPAPSPASGWHTGAAPPLTQTLTRGIPRGCLGWGTERWLAASRQRTGYSHPRYLGN
jgi:hypothetical protein